MPSNKLSKKALIELTSLARTFALTADKNSLGGLPANVFEKYGGAKVLQKTLDRAELAAIKCGSEGDWLAVLPLKTLLGLISDARQFQRICDND